MTNMNPIQQITDSLEAILAPQPAIQSGWATAYAAFKGAFDTPLARRRDSGEYAQDARRLLREFNDAMLAAPEAPQPAKQPLTREELFELAEPFGEFQYGDAQGHKRIDFANAIIAAYERKNGVQT